MSRKNGRPPARQQRQQKEPTGLRVREWYTMPGTENVARRREVWGLLGWYHREFVEPHLGFSGAFRRLWWRITGQYGQLLSPWAQLELRLAALAEQHAAEAELELRQKESAPQ